MSDVSEQSAKLNTLMRFEKSQRREALPFAYKYRLDLQLQYPYSERTLKALRQVEEAIEMLEKLKVPRWKVWLRHSWNSLVDSIQNLGQVKEAKPSSVPPVPEAETAEAVVVETAEQPETSPEAEERS